jgi:hypothetical protein
MRDLVAVGRFADRTVIGKNLLRMAPKHSDRAAVISTLFRGKAVCRAKQDPKRRPREHPSAPAASLDLERRRRLPAPRQAPRTARATGRCRPRVAIRPAAAFASLSAADLEEAVMSQASITVAVDAQLHWVVRVPEALAGATRAASSAQLARLVAEFDAMQVAADDAARAEALVGTIASAVIECLGEPPDLPFIGEPFGGEDGTD